MSRDSVISVAFAAAIFCVYAAGACRTIYVGDSGELVTAVAVLGIPHPSGYPLYVLLGKLFTALVPVGSIAFRMSLFSALCAAISCAIFYRIVREVTGSIPAGLFTGLLLAASPSFWAEANIQRVYALNAFFVAATTLLFFRWLRKGDNRLFIAAMFLCGLGATNHTFMAVFGLAVVLVAIAKEHTLLRRPRSLLLAAFAFVAGLLPYAYLPLRSRMNPLLDWGNAETLNNFLKVVSRSDFWGRRWYRGPADLLPIAGDLLRSFADELSLAGVSLVILALVVARHRRWPIVLPVVIIIANFLAMAFHGSRSDLFIWHRYYIPAYMMVALLAGFGAATLLERLPARFHYVVLAIPLALMIGGYRAHDLSHYRIGEDFSATLLRTLPPGSTLIANDDNILFVLMYLMLGEERRPDVSLILEGVGGIDLPPLHFDPDEDPLFLTHHPNWKVQGLAIIPVGLTFRAWRSDRPPPPAPVIKEHLDGETNERVPKDYLTHNLIGHFHYMLGVTNEERDWLRASREFKAATAAAPDNDVLFYNLGLIYARNGLFDDAIAALRRSHEINPRGIISGKPVSAANQLQIVVQERDRVRTLEMSFRSTLRGLNELDYERQMSARLAAVDEFVAARGHHLRAMELASNAVIE